MDVKKLYLLFILLLAGCTPSTPIEDTSKEDITELTEESKENITEIQKEEYYEDLQDADDTFNALDKAFNALSKN